MTSKITTPTENKPSNWAPLVKLVGEQNADDYMLMGDADGIMLYKHRITRRYLNIDRQGRTYAYGSDSHSYFEVPTETAVKYATAGKETL